MAEKKELKSEKTVKPVEEKSETDSAGKASNVKTSSKAQKTESSEKSPRSETEKKTNSEKSSSKPSSSSSAKQGASASGKSGGASVTLKKLTKNQMFTAIALVVIGILFCALRSGLVSVLLTIVGVILIGLGIYEAVRKEYVQGISEIVVGVIIIVCGWTIAEITLLILGIAFIGYAVYEVIKRIPRLKSEKNNIGKMLLTLVYPLLILTLGIILIVARWAFVDGIFIALGVIFIVGGVSLMIKVK